MSNTAVATKKTNEISTVGAEKLRDSIKEGLRLVSQGYLAITPDVAKLYDCKGFKALGYKNFDEMCMMEFGMSHGTTVGIRKVFDKFGSVTNDNKYIIPEKYLEYGYTKLLLFTDKKFEEVGINPIEEFTPDMTIAEMKDALRLRLDKKAEAQDATAVDTTAKDVTDSEAPHDNAENESYSEELENVEATYSDRSKEVIELVKGLWNEAKEKGMKPEKMVLYEAIIANLKEAEKAFKALK